MKCEGCSNPAATRISYSSKGETCDKCGSPGKFTFADVFFKKPYVDHNIVNPVTHPFGMEITSRRHKSEVMRANGLKESGDKRHGSRSPF